jgi:predicted CXXCH cytochrome family protein
MIPVHSFNIDGECQHCHKARLGTFGATVNNRRLALCYKCLANLLDVFGEEAKDEMPRPLLERMGNGA